jgi:hypothetical protein
MTLLLPFYMLKLRKKIAQAGTNSVSNELSTEMRNLLDNLYAAIRRGEDEGQLSDQDKITVVSILQRMYKEVYKPYKNILEEDIMIIKDSPLSDEFEAMIEERNKQMLGIAKMMAEAGIPRDKVCEATFLSFRDVQPFYSNNQSQTVGVLR